MVHTEACILDGMTCANRKRRFSRDRANLGTEKWLSVYVWEREREPLSLSSLHECECGRNNLYISSRPSSTESHGQRALGLGDLGAHPICRGGKTNVSQPCYPCQWQLNRKNRRWMHASFLSVLPFAHPSYPSYPSDTLCWIHFLFKQQPWAILSLCLWDLGRDFQGAGFQREHTMILSLSIPVHLSKDPLLNLVIYYIFAHNPIPSRR